MARSILITGCSSGIGYRSAEMLHERGYRVFATARDDVSLQKLRDMGVAALHLDVTDFDAYDAVLEQVSQATGGTLDVLFNNAGYSQVGAAEDLSLEALRAQFETNFFAPVELGNRVIKKFFRPQGGGVIIQNSSVFGLTSLPFRAAYSSSKYALEAFSDALRQEQKNFKTGVRVVLIEPGPIVSRVRQNKQKYFKKYIEPIMNQSRFKSAYEKMQNSLAMTGRIPMTEEPDAVVDKLILAIERENPAPRYYVTRLTHTFMFFKRTLPHSWFDKVAAKVSKKETG